MCRRSHHETTHVYPPPPRSQIRAGIRLVQQSRSDQTECRRRTNMCNGGFIDGARPTWLRTGSAALGRLPSPSKASNTKENLRTLKGEFLERLRTAEAGRPIGRVLLDLHGAMGSMGLNWKTAEEDFIFAAVTTRHGGPPSGGGGGGPIVVTFDLARNQARKRIENDAPRSWASTPIRQRRYGRPRTEAVPDIIVRTLRQEIHPVMRCAIPCFGESRPGNCPSLQ